MILDHHPAIRALSVADKLELVHELWEEIEAKQDEIPLSDDCKAELDRRWAEYERDPSQGSTWEVVRERILSRKKAAA